MRFTRTHTVWFGDEELAPLREAVRSIREDAAHRYPHLTDDARAALMLRVALLHSALDLLAEPVPESIG